MRNIEGGGEFLHIHLASKHQESRESETDRVAKGFKGKSHAAQISLGGINICLNTHIGIIILVQDDVNAFIAHRILWAE